MHRSKKTRIEPFNSTDRNHHLRTKNNQTNQNNSQNVNLLTKKSIIAIAVVGVVFVLLAIAAVVIPIIYNFYTSQNQTKSTETTTIIIPRTTTTIGTGTTVSTTIGTTVTTTIGTTVSTTIGTTISTTIGTTATTTLVSTTTTLPSLRWNITGRTVAGNSGGSTGISANLLARPSMVVFDLSNALYIADADNNRIQKWSNGTSTGITIAGLANGTAGTSTSAFNHPVGIAFDSSYNMYISEQGNHRVIYWVNGASSGTVVAGITGSAGNSNNQLYYPSGLVFVSSTNTLYIADQYNHRLMRYILGASSGTVVAGGNGAGTSNNQLNYPTDMIFDSSSNSFLITNYGCHSIVRWVLGATSWTLVIGSPGTSGDTPTLINKPICIGIDPYGNVYVPERATHRVRLFLSGQSNGTTIVGTYASPGVSATQFNYSSASILDNQMNLYITDTNNHRIQMFRRY